MARGAEQSARVPHTRRGFSLITNDERTNKMTLVYDEGINLIEDEPLLKWMDWFTAHVSNGSEDHVFVKYAPRKLCVVAGNNLVNYQYTLSDDRLIRFDHVSPRKKGEQQSYHILCEIFVPSVSKEDLFALITADEAFFAIETLKRYTYNQITGLINKYERSDEHCKTILLNCTKSNAFQDYFARAMQYRARMRGEE